MRLYSFNNRQKIEVVANCDHLRDHLKSTNMKNAISIVPDEVVLDRILMIRNKRVMIDSDLAELYGVSTKRLNKQVKRNHKRFPLDFMFQLTAEEKKFLIEKNTRLNKLKYSSSLPLAFTEHGAVMMASVLNSEWAIQVNIQIVRIFTRIRELLLSHKDLLLKLEQLEKKLFKQDDPWRKHEAEILLIFGALKKLMSQPDEPKRRIGFKTKYDED